MSCHKTIDGEIICPAKKPEKKEVSIDKENLRELITNVLQMVDANCGTRLYSENAVEQLMLTAATESHLGKYLKQVGGPAEGLYQMEPRTTIDIIENYVQYHPELMKAVELVTPSHGIDNISMQGSIPLQTLMARIHYLRVPDSLPSKDDVEGMANYWKAHYNTRLGKGTVEKAIESYERYVV